MNPEEKELFKKTLEFSEENNRILRGMQRSARWGAIWGFIKLLIVLAPLVVGYIYLEPHFSAIKDSFEGIQEILNTGAAANSLRR